MKAAHFLVSILVATDLSATEVTPWPPDHKAAAIAGCRASIANNAKHDYLKRSQLTELPADFDERIAPVMEPFLAVCDCVYEHFESMWTFEYYESHQAEVLSKLKELMNGACRVQAPDEPSVEPESDASQP